MVGPLPDRGSRRPQCLADLRGGGEALSKPAHFRHGRVAMDYLHPVPFILAWLWCLLRFESDRKWGFVYAGAAVLGVGVYSYISSIAMPAQFAFFHSDYLGDYRIRSAGAFESNLREAVDEMVRLAPGCHASVSAPRCHTAGTTGVSRRRRRASKGSRSGPHAVFARPVGATAGIGAAISDAHPGWRAPSLTGVPAAQSVPSSRS